MPANYHGRNNSGNDYFWGDASNETIRGGNGDDTLSGWEGSDHLFGDDGNDYIEAVGRSWGWDISFGGNGNDTIEGDSFVILSWFQRHYYYSGSAYGDDGDDRIINNQNSYGGNGNDTIEKGGIKSGGRGEVPYFWFDGGPGDDTLRILNQGSGQVRNELNNQDHIWGGDGNDVITHTQDTNARINGGSGTDMITIAPELNRAKVVFGGDGADLFILKPNNNQDPDRIDPSLFINIA
jgi:Ca2+-binding RTX toxin-like protein